MTEPIPTASLLPLAAGQERDWEFMWALSPGDPGRAFRTVVATRMMQGRLNDRALRQALIDVVRRHEVLRLTVPVTGAQPQALIRGETEPPFETVNLSKVSATRQKLWLEQLAFLEPRRVFDLTHGPLWHAWLVRLAPDRHLLCASFLHLIADGWAGGVFMDDLFACYGYRAGLVPSPPADPPSFAEISAVQAQRLDPTPERVRFWRKQFETLPDTSLPAPVLQPGADLLGRTAIDFELPDTVVRSVRRVGWRARTTSFVCMLAAYHLTLGLAKDRERIALSTTSGGRRTERDRRAMSQFATEVYVTAEVSDAAKLGQVVRCAHAGMAAAMANQVPYTALAGAANARFEAERPWPDVHLRDGDFSAWAPDGADPQLPGLHVAEVYSIGQAPTGWKSTTLVGGESLSAAWRSRCGPSMVVNTGRTGGAVIFNDQVFDAEEMGLLVSAYAWTVSALAGEPEMTVADLRRRFQLQFGALFH